MLLLSWARTVDSIAISSDLLKVDIRAVARVVYLFIYLSTLYKLNFPKKKELYLRKCLFKIGL